VSGEVGNLLLHQCDFSVFLLMVFLLLSPSKLLRVVLSVLATMSSSTVTKSSLIVAGLGTGVTVTTTFRKQ